MDKKTELWSIEETVLHNKAMGTKLAVHYLSGELRSDDAARRFACVFVSVMIWEGSYQWSIVQLD